jgi:predicted amidohydrolase YtcJ
MRRRTLLQAGAGAGLWLLAGCDADSGNPSPTTSGPEVPADLLVYGGPILTMDPRQPRVEAVAVAGDRIVAVGDRAELAGVMAPGARTVDLAGATLMPGFVDAHSHYFGRPDAAGTDIAGVSDYVASLGITTTGECFVDAPLLAALKDLESQGRLGVRLSAYLAANNACGDPLGDWWSAHAPTRSAGELLRIGGVKVYLDGGSCHAPAASFAYGDGSHGDLYFTADQLTELLSRIDTSGHQAAVHALGDRAVDTVLTAFEAVIGATGNRRRHRIEHSAVTRPDLRARHGKVGAVVTIFGAYPTCFLTGTNETFKYRTPEEYLNWEWAWRGLIDASPGAHFAWHADFPVFNPGDPVHALSGFVTRAQVSGDGSVCQPSAAMAEGAITVDEALRLMTTGAAYALFRENEVGQLAPGLFADFVVLSEDPTAVAPARLAQLRVLVTVIGGKAAWCGPRQQGLCASWPARLGTAR